MADRRDSALLELALDAARVTDDYVRGVLENTTGTAGGSEHVRRGRFMGALAAIGLFGERPVVRAMGARYGPEQLRKAAEPAEDLVAAVAALADAWTPAARGAVGRLAALGLADLPELLRDGDVTRAGDVHERLTRAIATMNEARTAAVLFEMRQARDQGEHPSS